MLSYWIKRNKADLLCLFALGIFCVLVWLPTRYLPYHWDAAGFINPSANHLIKSSFSPLVTIGSDFAHPPLIPALLALIKIILGSDVIYAHALIFPFLPLYLGSVFFLIRKFTNPFSAVCGSFIVALCPVVLSEYGNIYIDLPSSALALTAAVLWLYRLPLIATVCFTLAVLTKETAILLLPFFIVYKPEKISRITQSISWLAPLIVLISWFAYHYQATGWYFFSPDSGVESRYLQSFFEMIMTLEKIVYHTFITQYRFLLSIPFFISLTLYLKNINLFPPIIRRYILSLISVLVLILSFYLIGSEYLSRYILLSFPLLVIITVLIWSLLVQFKFQLRYHLLFIYTLILCLTFSFTLRPKTPLLTGYDFRPPSDLKYQDMIRLFSEAAGFISTSYINETILGSFPESLYFTDSTNGYVSTPMKFIECQNYNPNLTQRAVVVIHPFSPGQYACKKIIDNSPNLLVLSLESADLWLDLYEITASPSAQISSDLQT